MHLLTSIWYNIGMVQQVTTTVPNHQTFAANADDMCAPKSTGNIFSLNDISNNAGLRAALASGHRGGITNIHLTEDGEGHDANSPEGKRRLLQQILIQEQIEQISKQIAAIDIKLLEIDKKIAYLNQKEAEVDGQISTLQSDLLETGKDLKELALKDKNLATKQEDLEDRKAQVEVEISEAEKILKEELELKEGIAKADKEIEDGNTRLGNIQKQRGYGEDRFEKGGELEEGANTTIKQAQTEKSILGQRLEELKNSEANPEHVRLKLPKLNDELNDINTSLDQITAERNEISLQQETLENKINEIKDQISKLEEEKSITQAERLELETEKSDLLTQRQALSEQLTELQNTLDVEESNLNEQAQDLQEHISAYEVLAGYIEEQEGSITYGEAFNQTAALTDNQKEYLRQEAIELAGNDEKWNSYQTLLQKPLHSEVAQTAKNNSLIKAGILPETPAPQQSGLYDGNTADPSNPNSPFKNASQNTLASSSPAGYETGVNATGTFAQVAAPGQNAADSPVADQSQHPLHAVEQPETPVNTAGTAVTSAATFG